MTTTEAGVPSNSAQLPETSRPVPLDDVLARARLAMAAQELGSVIATIGESMLQGRRMDPARMMQAVWGCERAACYIANISVNEKHPIGPHGVMVNPHTLSDPVLPLYNLLCEVAKSASLPTELNNKVQACVADYARRLLSMMQSLTAETEAPNVRAGMIEALRVERENDKSRPE